MGYGAIPCCVCVSVCEGSVWEPGRIRPGPYLSVNFLCFAASPVEVRPPPPGRIRPGFFELGLYFYQNVE